MIRNISDSRTTHNFERRDDFFQLPVDSLQFRVSNFESQLLVPQSASCRLNPLRTATGLEIDDKIIIMIQYLVDEGKITNNLFLMEAAHL